MEVRCRSFEESLQKAIRMTDAAVLDRLYATIESRKGADPASSYTAKLFSRGVAKIAQKVGEEGVETALAVAAGDRKETITEAADLLYHLQVDLMAAGVSPLEIYAELEARSEGGSSQGQRTDRPS